jgi:hypothetical protein
MPTVHLDLFLASLFPINGRQETSSVPSIVGSTANGR